LAGALGRPRFLAMTTTAQATTTIHIGEEKAASQIHIHIRMVVPVGRLTLRMSAASTHA
jgi:hypothetical protein